MNNDNNVNNHVNDMNRSSEEKDYRNYAEKLKLEYVDLRGYPISSDALRIIAKEDAIKYGVISYLRVGNKVKIATPDPESEKFKNFLESLRNITKYNFLISITSPSNIENTLDLYNLVKEESEIKRTDTKIEITAEELERFNQSINSLRDLKEELEKVPTSFLLELIITGALKTEASDIHIEAEETEAIVRYRIDGVLHPIISLSPDALKAITSRIKFLAKLKLDINKLPQDGKFFVNSSGRRIDIRVSTLPEMFGESIVMRLLDKELGFVKLEELGLNQEQFNRIREAYQKPHGLIFVTGPTGSGKTTTLYAVLEKLNKPGVKIITLEDPVEYTLGVIQSQVNAETNYTFSSGLRSILRQDPDILLVGEVRDLETAEMAIQASLTGHLVLTTLHTNDVSSSIHRLIDMGVRPFLVVDAINLIMAQRLVRKICSKCREEYVPEKTVIDEIKKVIPRVKLGKFFRGKGCDFCHHTGFKGRIGIFEMLELDEEIKELTLRAATLDEINKAAIKNGMITMEQDGLLKVLQGITTPEEVWRVVKG